MSSPFAGAASTTTGDRRRTRERIANFYRRYCPDKPISHVDFLMEKYAGHEEEVIDILKEKYGPEPVDRIPHSDVDRVAAILQSPMAAAVLSTQFSGQPAALRQTLIDKFGPEPHITGRGEYGAGLVHSGIAGANTSSSRGGGDPAFSHMQYGDRSASADMGTDAMAQAGAILDAELAKRREQYERDMALLFQQEARREEMQVMQAVTETKLELQRQDVEMQQLRLALSAAKTQAAANSEAHEDDIRRVAQQLTRAKLKLLSMKSLVDPSMVSAERLKTVVAKTTETEEELARSVQYCRYLAEVVRRHFRIYPLSPMHVTLRSLDAAMCSRLEA